MLPFLLADWFEAVVPILVVAFWILRAFLEAKGNGNEEPVEIEALDEDPFDEAQMAQDRGMRAEARGPAKARAGGQGEMRSEVDDFLSRLSGEGQSARERPPREAQEQQRFGGQSEPSTTGEYPQSSPPRRKPKRRKPNRQEPPRQSESVAEHVREHVGRLKESQLAENAAHLGEMVASSDDRMAERLHEKFDHKLGTLSSEGRDQPHRESQEPEPPTSAEMIADLLASPDSVRNAIILNEILQRPADRL